MTTSGAFDVLLGEACLGPPDGGRRSRRLCQDCDVFVCHVRYGTHRPRHGTLLVRVGCPLQTKGEASTENKYLFTCSRVFSFFSGVRLIFFFFLKYVFNFSFVLFLFVSRFFLPCVFSFLFRAFLMLLSYVFFLLPYVFRFHFVRFSFFFRTLLVFIFYVFHFSFLRFFPARFFFSTDPEYLCACTVITRRLHKLREKQAGKIPRAPYH